MKVVIPLPFGEIAFDFRTTRRSRPLFWYTLLSLVLHCLAILLFGAALIRALLPVSHPTQKPVMVSISSALRIEHAHPKPAHQPIPHPHAAQTRQTHAAPQAQPQPVQVARVASAHRPELSKPAKVAYAQAPRLTQSQIATDTHAYEQTIARARAASDPVAGASNEKFSPTAPTRLTMNIRGNFGKPQPEGVLYPIKRWVDGAYVYYYVRYTAEYADGETETGLVPWPIRFPADNDPFAHDLHHMPLPGPLPDYVLPADVSMQPLVKNCWDHHYDYCPIQREDESAH